MTRQDKCEMIIKKIAELVDSGQFVKFEQDWGRWTATIFVGSAHTHVGIPEPDGNFDIFVDNLYDSLVVGNGLSWVMSQQEE